MENEPSTPIQSPPADVNDLSGPGLFSAEKNARTEMDNPEMNEQPGSDVSSEKAHVEHDEDEQQESNIGSSPSSSQSQRSNETTTPAVLETTHQNQPSTAAHTMAPPPIPNFKATPTSAQPAHLPESELDQEPPATPINKNGGSKSRIPTSSKQEKSTARAINGKRRRDEPDQQQQPPAFDDPATEAFNDPSNPLPPFDWTDLESRYHHKMNDYAQQEGEIYRSFHELCDVSIALLSSLT